jgi:hypothetical protein
VRSDLGGIAALLADRVLKHGWQHEAITDDRDDRPRTREVFARTRSGGSTAIIASASSCATIPFRSIRCFILETLLLLMLPR